MQVLYTSEIRNQPPSVLLETGRCLNEDGPLSDYALKLLDGIESHRDVIDDYIESASDNWQVSRMPISDRMEGIPYGKGRADHPASGCL